jgi:hypothetical protein
LPGDTPIPWIVQFQTAYLMPARQQLRQS